jgi:NhaC family Na+:H+ antiporter
MVEDKNTTIRPLSYLDALIPIIVLVILLASSVYLYGADETGRPIQFALMLSMMVTSLVGLKNGHKW